MIVIGLTGSIGMGKSTAVEMLRRIRVPVHDADATVHRLLGPGGAAVARVAAAFPDCLCNGGIDRKRLGARVFEDPPALRRLEAILHPLVAADRDRFLREAARRRASAVVLDVPLLFETGGDALCDITVLMTAPEFVQRSRVLVRSGQDPARLAAILDAQTPDFAKRRLASLVVQTGLGKRPVRERLAALIAECAGRKGAHWPPRAGGWRRRSNRPIILRHLKKPLPLGPRA
ncbi:MAG: dephospho-CoA kinase [Alphaproteobacteria bacterium]|nr:dephospho-CoA kinase [Alphaproteobacteria bacterium]